MGLTNLQIGGNCRKIFDCNEGGKRSGAFALHFVSRNVDAEKMLRLLLQDVAPSTTLVSE